MRNAYELIELLRHYLPNKKYKNSEGVNEEVTTVPPTPKIYNHLPLSEDSSDTYPDVSVVNARRMRGRWRTGSWTQVSYKYHFFEG